jgi:predicted deacylase
LTHTPPFNAWTEQDVLAWRKKQKIQRSYENEVVSKIRELSERFVVTQYGELAYEKKYPLYLVRSKELDPSKPNVLITGGVHGYETSGPHGALEFMLTQASDFENDFNFVCAPCVSPWGYETINRWNPDAIDPNRNFFKQSPAQE